MEPFVLGDIRLESGVFLRDARIAYKLHGRLNGERTNAVLLPSFITGTHDGYLPFIGPGRCFDPEKNLIIATNLFGNGVSTSPSNAGPGQRGPDFPVVSIRDNVAAQHRLLTQHLGLDRLALVAGYSMGAQQAYQWAVSYPRMVERLAVWCGHARTTPHTAAFLGGLRAAIQASSDWQGGNYATPPLRALRTLARVYAPWGLSQGWYRREAWRLLGFPTLAAFVSGFWEAAMADIEANGFLAQIATWLTHDVGQTPGFEGDWRAALRSINVPAVVMPGATDLYFPAEDAREEASCMNAARFMPIASDWGHFAGIGIDEASRDAIDSAIKELLLHPVESP